MLGTITNEQGAAGERFCKWCLENGIRTPLNRQSLKNQTNPRELEQKESGNEEVWDQLSASGISPRRTACWRALSRKKTPWTLPVMMRFARRVFIHPP